MANNNSNNGHFRIINENPEVETCKCLSVNCINYYIYILIKWNII